MTGYQPARLIELIDDEPTGDEIEGEALIFVFYDERGVMEASGTFKTGGERFGSLKGLIGRLFQYEGSAFEGNRRYKLRARWSLQAAEGSCTSLKPSANLSSSISRT